MMSKKELNTSNPQKENQEIDLMELAQRVWAERKLIFKWCGIAALIGLIIGFSIPREYSSSVRLAPEAANSNMGGNMNALAAMAGINMGVSRGGDALSPNLYPDIVSSTPFLIELFSVQVEDIDGEIKTSVFDYISEHQKSPWWNIVMSAPFQLLGWGLSLFKSQEEDMIDQPLDPFRLTRKEASVARALKERIFISIDNKTGVTSISVTMQDPLISAALTDTVMVKLQNYITDYRTNKARKDLAFSKKLFDDAKENYFITQEKYASYVDRNSNMARESFRSESTRLLNEMNLAYSVYSQLAQQLEVAKAKVQEITPVYTIVQPATVPLRPSKPSKMMILIGFVFLAGVAGVGWILFVKDMIASWKDKQNNFGHTEHLHD